MPLPPVAARSRSPIAQTWERARRLAGALRGLGVGDGDRVAVVGRNCHRYLELYQAVPGAGMVLVPLNQRHTAAELGYALRGLGRQGPVRRRSGVGPSARRGRARDRPRRRLRGAARRRAAGGLPRRAAPPRRSPACSTPAGRPAPSKGVMLTHRNLIANAFHFQAQFAFRPTPAGWSRRRCSTPPGRSRCWPPCGTAAARSRCRAVRPRRRRSTSSRPSASRRRWSCRRCSRRSPTSSSRGRATCRSLRLHQPRRRAGGHRDAAPRTRRVPRAPS